MNAQRWSVASLLVALILGLSSTAGAAAPAAYSEDIIARFEGADMGMVRGQSVLQVGLTIMPSKTEVVVSIPNDDAKKGAKPTPRKELADAVKKFTKGESYVKVGVAKSNLGPTLTSIEEYTINAGEDTPNGYVFSKTVDTGKTTTVYLTKFGVSHPFTIPMVKGEKDQDVVAQMGKVSEGSTVWIQSQGGKLLAIEPYTEPKEGTLGKLGMSDVDGHKIRNAEIETDGKVVTVLVPFKIVGKAVVPDAAVTAELAKVHQKGAVQYRIHEDNGVSYLREILPAAKTGEKKMDTSKKTKPDATKK